ncbi:hypothetical protein MVEN_01792600 [Mycena venus]|uniref:Uncharacterized protein n=1 Tax=Mycena venus TaxID=2733690 RepID=A0A8H6XIX0_9AGAR|nr:hypothetical protein MVEN_01792600 [Mycena venus]
MAKLDECLAAAIDVAVLDSNPRFFYHLQTRGLASLIKAVSTELVHDYRSAGENLLDRCVLDYFIQNEVPHGLRVLIEARVISPITLYRLVSTHWSKHGDADSNDFLSHNNLDIPADTVSIFFGAMATVPDLDALEWFRETFGPIIDGLVLAYCTYLEEPP